MVKLEDGSMVYAGQLLGGEGQDDEGKSLKFKANEDTDVPFYRAEAPMKDGSGRKKVYTFDLGTTQVKVSVSIVEPEEKEKEDKSKKEKEGEENSGEEVTATKKSAESEGLRATTEAKIVKTTPPGRGR